jgi:hypothetical protein
MYSAARWHLSARCAARCRREVFPRASSDGTGIGFGHCLDEFFLSRGAATTPVDASVRPWLGPATSIAEPVRLDRAWDSIKDRDDRCVVRLSQGDHSIVAGRGHHFAPCVNQAPTEPVLARLARLRRCCIFRGQPLGRIEVFVNTKARGRPAGHQDGADRGRADARSQTRTRLRATRARHEATGPQQQPLMPLKMNQSRAKQSAPRRPAAPCQETRAACGTAAAHPDAPPAGSLTACGPFA